MLHGHRTAEPPHWALVRRLLPLWVLVLLLILLLAVLCCCCALACWVMLWLVR